jgi:predicted metal-dependent HD superfamily phosphohydrolase
MQRWQEPHRAYHTPTHLSNCLAALDVVKDNLTEDEIGRISIALYWHDAVYNPPNQNLEIKSAGVLREDLWDILPSERIGWIQWLIIVTSHQIPPFTMEEKAICDVDLHELALPWDQFSENSRRIRKEHSCYSDLDFAKGRSAWAKQMLTKPIFHSTRFSEDAARRNLERHIEELDKMVKYASL